MRDDAHRPRTERHCQDPALFGPRDEFRRIRRALAQVEHEDVRLHRRQIEIDVRAFGELFGKQARVRVVFRQPLELMIQGVDGRCGQDADLTHGAAEHAPMARRERNESARAGQDRSGGRPEALRERDGHDVERRRQLGRRTMGGHRGVPDARAVEKRRDPRARAAVQTASTTSCGTTTPPRAVVRVLDLDEGRRRIEQVTSRLVGVNELVRREDAAGADLGELHTGVRRAAAGLVPDGVALAADDHVVARTGERAQRHLVGHRARRQPERRLLAEQLGDALLQRVDRRVFAELIVADVGRGHRGAHAGRGIRDGIGAEIDR